MHALAQDDSAVDTLTQKIIGSNGLAHTQASLVMDTNKLVGAWEAATGATQELYTAIGAYLEPTAVKLLNTWSELVPKLEAFGDAISKGDWGTVGSMLQEGFRGALSTLLS